jgi:hypothetical protein
MILFAGRFVVGDVTASSVEVEITVSDARGVKARLALLSPWGEASGSQRMYCREWSFPALRKIVSHVESEIVGFTILDQFETSWIGGIEGYRC